MPKTKLAFDTNIWIYLLDRKSSFHNLARKAFAKVEKEGWEIIIAQQNLLELIEVLIAWYGYLPKAAIREAQMIIGHNVRIVQPLPQTLNTYFTLAALSLKKNNNFDLYLAATLLDNGIKNLVTNDKSGFKGLKGIEVKPLKEFVVDKKLRQEIKKGWQEIKAGKGVPEVKAKKNLDL